MNELNQILNCEDLNKGRISEAREKAQKEVLKRKTELFSALEKKSEVSEDESKKLDDSTKKKMIEIESEIQRELKKDLEKIGEKKKNNLNKAVEHIIKILFK